jgi:hypothetical protein
MKTITLLLFLLFCNLSAEPILGILKEVSSNNSIHFLINANQFTCKNYGIIMIDDVSDMENTCKKRLVDFMSSHPEYQTFSATHLIRFQQYRIHMLENACIINAQGRKSLAEMLLEHGLAVRDRSKKNSVYDYKFKRSERRARVEKKGIYSDTILRSCINVLQ